MHTATPSLGVEKCAPYLAPSLPCHRPARRPAAASPSPTTPPPTSSRLRPPSTSPRPAARSARQGVLFFMRQRFFFFRPPPSARCWCATRPPGAGSERRAHAHTYTYTYRAQCGDSLALTPTTCCYVKTLPYRSLQAEAEALVDLTLCNALARPPLEDDCGPLYSTRILPRPAALSVFAALVLTTQCSALRRGFLFFFQCPVVL